MPITELPVDLELEVYNRIIVCQSPKSIILQDKSRRKSPKGRDLLKQSTLKTWLKDSSLQDDVAKRTRANRWQLDVKPMFESGRMHTVSPVQSGEVEVKIELGHRATLKPPTCENGFTHDWSVFVRGPEGCNIQHFIEKVVFTLHPSFPKPKRVIKEPPYSVTEAGYASFHVPIDIYFKNKNEPKKLNFQYDLFLRVDEPVNHIRCEKLTFQNPTDDFRKRLILSGGVCKSGGAVSDGKHKSVTTKTASPPPPTSEQPNPILSRPLTPESKKFHDFFGPPDVVSSKPKDEKKAKQPIKCEKEKSSATLSTVKAPTESSKTSTSPPNSTSKHDKISKPDTGHRSSTPQESVRGVSQEKISSSHRSSSSSSKHRKEKSSKHGSGKHSSSSTPTSTNQKHHDKDQSSSSSKSSTSKEKHSSSSKSSSALNTSSNSGDRSTTTSTGSGSKSSSDHHHSSKHLSGSQDSSSNKHHHNTNSEHKSISGNHSEYKSISGNSSENKSISGNHSEYKSISGNSSENKSISGNSKPSHKEKSEHGGSSGSSSKHSSSGGVSADNKESSKHSSSSDKLNSSKSSSKRPTDESSSSKKKKKKDREKDHDLEERKLKDKESSIYRDLEERKLKDKESSIYRDLEERKLKDKESSIYRDLEERKLKDKESSIYRDLEERKLKDKESSIYRDLEERKLKDKESSIYHDLEERKVKDKESSIYKHKEVSGIESSAKKETKSRDKGEKVSVDKDAISDALFGDGPLPKSQNEKEKMPSKETEKIQQQSSSHSQSDKKNEKQKKYEKIKQEDIDEKLSVKEKESKSHHQSIKEKDKKKSSKKSSDVKDDVSNIDYKKEELKEKHKSTSKHSSKVTETKNESASRSDKKKENNSPSSRNEKKRKKIEDSEDDMNCVNSDSDALSNKSEDVVMSKKRKKEKRSLKSDSRKSKDKSPERMKESWRDIYGSSEEDDNIDDENDDVVSDKVSKSTSESENETAPPLNTSSQKIQKSKHHHHDQKKSTKNKHGHKEIPKIKQNSSHASNTTKSPKKKLQEKYGLANSDSESDDGDKTLTAKKPRRSGRVISDDSDEDMDLEDSPLEDVHLSEDEDGVESAKSLSKKISSKPAIKKRASPIRFNNADLFSTEQSDDDPFGDNSVPKELMTAIDRGNDSDFAEDHTILSPIEQKGGNLFLSSRNSLNPAITSNTEKDLGNLKSSPGRYNKGLADMGLATNVSQKHLKQKTPPSSKSPFKLESGNTPTKVTVARNVAFDSDSYNSKKSPYINVSNKSESVDLSYDNTSSFGVSRSNSNKSTLEISSDKGGQLYNAGKKEHIIKQERDMELTDKSSNYNQKQQSRSTHHGRGTIIANKSPKALNSEAVKNEEGELSSDSSSDDDDHNNDSGSASDSESDNYQDETAENIRKSQIKKHVKSDSEGDDMTSKNYATGLVNDKDEKNTIPSLTQIQGEFIRGGSRGDISPRGISAAAARHNYQKTVQNISTASGDVTVKSESNNDGNHHVFDSYQHQQQQYLSNSVSNKDSLQQGHHTGDDHQINQHENVDKGSSREINKKDGGENISAITKAPNGEQLAVLLELQRKLYMLAGHSNKEHISKIMNIIMEANCYEIKEKENTFDFDLCRLDRGTLSKIRGFLQSV